MSIMSVKTFIQVAKLVLTPDNANTVLLRGETGIGKSQIVRKIAKHFDLPVIDRRLGQMTEGDIIGLPSTDGETTRFNPPDWYKEACEKPHVLFLDELNRGTQEVMQAAFQIVLDRELNGWKLHPQTKVCSAVNIGGRYVVNEMDPALLRRFFVADLEPTVDDWLIWAKESCEVVGNWKFGKQNVDDMFIDFIQSNTKFLDPPKNVESGTVTSTRHSWERLSDASIQSKIINDVENPLLYAMASGYVGTEAAIAFIAHAKNNDARVSGDEILNSYEKVQKKIKKLGAEKWMTCIEKLVEECNKYKTLTPTQGTNYAAFMKDLPFELRISLWQKTVNRNDGSQVEFVKSFHECYKHLIVECFANGNDPLKKKEETPTQEATPTTTTTKKTRKTKV